MRLLRILAAAGIGTLSPGAAHAQDVAFDSASVALAYHKLSGETLDLATVAASSDAVRHATEFDRRDATAAEVARLRALLASTPTSREFVVRVSDAISQYDHDRGEFSVGLFRPGYYVPMHTFGQEYRLIFANAESARSIPMPKEQARDFDARLTTMGRRVTNEIRFRVIGAGDPSGAVTGARVVRGELLAVRLLDDAGNVVFTPSVAAAAAVASSSSFDTRSADVAGFRVGVKGKALASTLERLFGPVVRRAARSNVSGIAAGLYVNEMRCRDIPGRRNAEPGGVCVTAHLDDDDVVRSVRIERVFPPVDGESFRRALVQKYGPVARADGGSDLALYWGATPQSPAVTALVGAPFALSARFEVLDAIAMRGLNAIPDVRVVLHLVDAEWASKQKAR